MPKRPRLVHCYQRVLINQCRNRLERVAEQLLLTVVIEIAPGRARMRWLRPVTCIGPDCTPPMALAL